MDALSKSQFELHLDAILNRKLETPKVLSGGFAMVNLLGSHNKAPEWQQITGASMHWYGKADNRPGRKMGHINVLGDNPTQALRVAMKKLREIQL